MTTGRCGAATGGHVCTKDRDHWGPHEDPAGASPFFWTDATHRTEYPAIHNGPSVETVDVICPCGAKIVDVFVGDRVECRACGHVYPSESWTEPGHIRHNGPNS